MKSIFFHSIREDRAKYLYNLDLGSAYYDPKTRSMRDNPLADKAPSEVFKLNINILQILKCIIYYLDPLCR